MTTEAGNRVIGIRHALKVFKEGGLVDNEHNYPEEAVEDVQDEILRTAVAYYRIGAKRGAIEAFDAILRGEFDVGERDGDRVVTANVKSISWKRGLKVRVGNQDSKVGRRRYKLPIGDIEFEE